MAGADWNDPRPMSPHIQVWKWHATMAASIFHRVTGVALYFGSVLIAAWVVALGLDPAADGSAPVLFNWIELAIASIPGQILLVLWAAAVLYHLANGIRHLLWDGPGIGFSPRVASAVSIFNFAFAILGAAAIWAGVALI